MPAIPIYLDTALDSVFCLFHPPADGISQSTAVLICAPWGWEEMASYRSRRHWAEQLAGAGHPTLRLDLPSSGDSSGMPGDPSRLESWAAAIARAAGWLRESGASSRVAGLGLGLGGLLVREAVSEGAVIDDLVLWAAPGTGRSFVRETRAFSRLQEGRPDGGGDANDASRLPDGWLETGGFVLSAETLKSLSSLDPRLHSTSSDLRRALLLDRDGITPDPKLQAGLEEAGVEVTVAPGVGWGAMVAHPERTKLPLGVVERVASWLRLAEGQVPAGGRGDREEPASSAQLESPVGPAETALEVDSKEVRESPLLVPQPYGDAFGVLAEPADPPETSLCVVFLNAGAVRHSGPNRLWVEASRRWASRGVRSLRVDLEGIGEADGDDSKRNDVASFYVPEFEQQVSVVLDLLEERGLGKRFVLVGLCAGGYWTFRVALHEPRAGVVVLLNAGALSWHDNLLSEREAEKLERVFQAQWWRKLLGGQVSPTRLWVFARLSLAKAGWALRALAARLVGRGSAAPGSRLEADLDQLRSAGARAVFAFSGGEPLYAELATKGVLERLDRWPNLTLVSLPGDDHTLRSAAAQCAAHELIDREVKRALAAQPDRQGGRAEPSGRS